MAQAFNDEIFHQNATIAEDGKIIYPNKTTHLTFSIEGTATSFQVAFEAQTHEGGKFLPCYCNSEGDNILVSTTATTLDTIWTKEIISLYSFRVRIVSISGGYIDVIGRSSEI